MNIQDMLTQAVQQRASDLHLSAGLPAMFRIDGSLCPASSQVLTHDDILQAMSTVMSPLQREHFEQHGSIRACAAAHPSHQHHSWLHAWHAGNVYVQGKAFGVAIAI